MHEKSHSVLVWYPDSYTAHYELGNQINSVYKYINSKLCNSTKPTELYDKNGTVTSDCEMMSELFSEAFASNFSKADNDSHLLTCDPRQSIYSETLNIGVDETRVLKTLLKLKDSIPGPDGIPSILMKKLAFQLVRPLTIIFQQPLFNDKVPSN